MIIWFDDAIFSGQVAQIDCLALLRQAALRRHTVLISDDPLQCLPSTMPNFTAWYETLPVGLQAEVDLLRERISLASANAVVRSSTQRILVSERHWALSQTCQIDVATALHALAQPLHILVENQINDGAFLRAVMPSDWRNKLQQWEERGQLRFVQGGGITEIKKFIERYSDDQHARTAYGYPAEMWWYLHFVIYDHDGDAEEMPSSDATAIYEFLQTKQRSKQGHRLNRRRQEHYMPKDAMLALLRVVATTYRFGQHDLTAKEKDIAEFYALNIASRFYNAKTPKLSGRLEKNYFAALNEHQVPTHDEWFEQDGSAQEMRLLAEAIAAVM
jgi:hypothetical protein